MSGPKSSTASKAVDSLAGARILDVAMGYAHALVIVSPAGGGAKVLEASPTVRTAD